MTRTARAVAIRVVAEQIEKQKPVGVAETVHATLELLCEDAAMADALEAWQKRLSDSRKRAASAASE